MQGKTKGGLRASRKDIEELCLMDDFFMQACFHENIPAAEKTLRIILANDKLKVISAEGQKRLPNLHGESAVLDVFAKDDKGRLLNIEVQIDNIGAGPKRARRNASLIDANVKNAGEYGEKLPEVYVIFITAKDILGAKKPIYHVNRKVEELDNQLFNDGSNIIYVNADIEETETDIGKLMHDFREKDPEKMYFPELSDKPKVFKKEGVSDMTTRYYRNLEAAEERGLAMGRLEGRLEGVQDYEKAMREAGMKEEEIERIRALAERQHEEAICSYVMI